MAGVVLGPAADTPWKAERSVPSDFYDAKGIVEELLANLPGISWNPMGEDPLFFHPLASFRLKTAHGELGAVGLLHPQAARHWELERENAAIFELDLDVLAALPPTARRRFKPFSLFPSSWRDLSVLLDKKTPYAQVEDAVRGCRLAELSKTELVDVFSGKSVPEGKKSLTLQLPFQPRGPDLNRRGGRHRDRQDPGGARLAPRSRPALMTSGHKLKRLETLTQEAVALIKAPGEENARLARANAQARGRRTRRLREDLKRFSVIASRQERLKSRAGAPVERSHRSSSASSG